MEHSHPVSKKITLGHPPVVGELIAKAGFAYGQDTRKLGPQLMVLKSTEAGITVWMDLMNSLDYFKGSFLPSQDLHTHTHIHMCTHTQRYTQPQTHQVHQSLTQFCN